jgi:hypothetical protein
MDPSIRGRVLTDHVLVGTTPEPLSEMCVAFAVNIRLSGDSAIFVGDLDGKFWPRALSSPTLRILSAVLTAWYSEGTGKIP